MFGLRGMPKFRDRKEGEELAAYTMLVAAAFIREHASDRMMHYDDSDCDGICIASELETGAEFVQIEADRIRKDLTE